MSSLTILAAAVLRYRADKQLKTEQWLIGHTHNTRWWKPYSRD